MADFGKIGKLVEEVYKQLTEKFKLEDFEMDTFLELFTLKVSGGVNDEFEEEDYSEGEGEHTEGTEQE